MKPGPKPGTYSHSAEKKDKIRESKLGTKRDSETKRKIGDSVRQSLIGTRKSAEHKDNIANALLDLETKCLHRFEELKADYPGQEDFFDDNKSDLLFAMQDCRSEQELTDLRRYIEVFQIKSSSGYDYSSSSMYAVEDTMIALLDAKRLLERTTNLVTVH